LLRVLTDLTESATAEAKRVIDPVANKMELTEKASASGPAIMIPRGANPYEPNES
jgi:hypothetical protein